MTYRVGAYVVDTSEDKVAQVIGHRGSHVQVRTPGGGAVWEVHASVLRLAMSQEREAVRALANSDGPAPQRRGCARCAELEAAWRVACAATGERTTTTGWALNRFRNHWRLDHVGAPRT
ncbi:hypothetical protein [Streptomyces nondiastaticus]|uniref:K Homology domain-containing protein n=1 Tax=Streptomyces nondiastaticus TaxID=3154512 RepID=A0ABW6TUY0_9ACTN